MKLLINFSILLVLSSIVSCKDQRSIQANKQEIDIINEILLKVVDTISYHEEKFTNAYMRDSMSYIKSFGDPVIAVYNKMDNIYEWETSILVEIGNQSNHLKQASFFNFQKIFSGNHMDTVQKILPVIKLSPGTIKLVPYADKKLRRIKGTISRIKFSRILYDDKSGVGLVVVTTADNVKSGKVKLVFLERIAGKWDVIANPVVEIW